MRLLLLVCFCCIAVCSAQQSRFESSPILFRNDATATANFPQVMHQPQLSLNRLSVGRDVEAEEEPYRTRFAGPATEMNPLEWSQRASPLERRREEMISPIAAISPASEHKELKKAKKTKKAKKEHHKKEHKFGEAGWVELTEREADSDMTGSGSRTSAEKYSAKMNLDLSKTKAHEHKGEGTGKAGVWAKLKQQMHRNQLEEMQTVADLKRANEPRGLKVLSGFTLDRVLPEEEERRHKTKLGRKQRLTLEKPKHKLKLAKPAGQSLNEYLNPTELNF